MENRPPPISLSTSKGKGSLKDRDAVAGCPQVPVDNPPNSDGSSVAVFFRLLSIQIKKTITSASMEFEALQQILVRLEPEILRQIRVEPQSKPAVVHWEKALESMRQGPSSALYPALKTLSPQLHWMQNPNYRSPDCPSSFLQNYAYAELVGCNGLCPSQCASMGIMLLGPETYYPPHVHPARECLYVLAGRGTWCLENGPIISLPPGKAMFIPPSCTHAFWSMDTPLAAIYLCSGDIASYPMLKPMPSTNSIP